MDPPSPQLVGRLVASGLCQPRDLRRCRARVRRLARDVPLFETVWLDALVQERKLTAYQAEVLATEHPEQLTVGPFVLVDRLGEDGRFSHFQARRRDAAALFLLSRPSRDSDSLQAGADRLQAFRDRTASLAHPGLALLHGFEHVDNRLWVASPWTPGATLQQLIVRRGRFPAACVAAIGLQVSEALATLQQAGAVHGDVRLRNVKLTPRGHAVLIVPGLKTAFFPEQSIHTAVPPDDCDGVAPELIGTGQPASPASDAYALGCLLWELLAGRPPFPHGDPLGKLSAHQTQRIPDIRDWAPDTPAGLASLILSLTDRQPAARPQNFREVTGALQSVRRASRGQVVQFIRGDSTALPVSHADRPPSRAGATALAAAVALLAAAGLFLAQPAARNELLSITQRSTKTSAPAPTAAEVPAAETEPVAASTTSRFQPLPDPDARGVIELQGRGPYSTRDLSFPRKLVIRGTGTERPVILIDGTALRITAQQLILDNLEIRSRTSAAGGDAETSPLLHVDVEQLAIRRCLFDQSPAAGAGIVWTVPDNATASSLIVAQTVFSSCGPALKTIGPPPSASFDNVLHCGQGALFEYTASDRSRRTVDTIMRRVTHRGRGPLIACRLGQVDRFLDTLTLTLEDCVCAPDRSALIEFLGPDAPADWQRQLQITGEGSLVPVNAEIVGLRLADDRLRPLPTTDVAIEGLMESDLGFAGAADGLPSHSTLVRSAGYSRSARPPGIDAAQLPVATPGAYNSGSLAVQHDRPPENGVPQATSP
ncbi:MAG: serine/threonine protein kinase [Planctomycetaceae bacterium]|nr:serine/threonine protein kinase [Planctomycetaceae bacterium]